MKLMALNLPRDMSEQELAELFKAYGNIKGCNLVMNEGSGTSKGFGFVEMALDHEAEVAIEELHGKKIKKCKIRVKKAS